MDFEAKDNANLQENAETSHKKKADKISKEQYLLQLPPHLADHHLFGDIHIHDLEYFGTRPFCQDWDLRYFLYYGLMPDGNGTKTSVARTGKAPGGRYPPCRQGTWKRPDQFCRGAGVMIFSSRSSPRFSMGCP